MQSKREPMCTLDYCESASSPMVTHILRHTYARTHTHTHIYIHTYIYNIYIHIIYIIYFLLYFDHLDTRQKKEKKIRCATS